MDNTMLAQEVVKDYGHCNGRPRCALKLDIKKAFNSISWSFICSTLWHMNLPSKFISWITECISTPAFSICFNGRLEGFIKGAKGIRQGEPLSPYLFIPCMEVLSKMLSSAASGGLFSYHTRSKKLGLTHLCFADDLMVFTIASPSSLLGIKTVLDQFYLTSGLDASYGKSEIYCSGFPLDVQTTLASIVGLQIGTLTVRYLGVPLSYKKLSPAACRPLLDKITSCISSWASRYLSYAGRLQLVNSVLSSLYGYWCTIFLLPTHLIKSVERLCCSFLWKGNSN